MNTPARFLRCTAALALLAAPLCATAATIALSPPNATVAPGSSTTMLLQVQGDGVTVGVEVEVRFSPVLVPIVVARPGAACSIDYPAGRIVAMRVNADRSALSAGATPICDISFDIDAGTAPVVRPLDVTLGLFSNAQALPSPGPHTLVDGTLTIADDGSNADAHNLTEVSNGDSTSPAADASGRYVVFQSTATTLDPADTSPDLDIYRLDTETGIATLISVDTLGNKALGGAIEPSVSADGSAIVFVAPDSGLYALDGETPKAAMARRKGFGFAVLLRNLLTNTTQRVGNAVPGGTGSTPRIAPGSGAIVYTGQDPSNPNQTEVFRQPLSRVGNALVPVPIAKPCISCKTIQSNGQESMQDSDGSSRAPVISADGQWVAWETEAKNLVVAAPSPCPNAAIEILLRNLFTGAVQRVSTPTNPSNCGPPGSRSRKPGMDWTGRKIVYQSDQPLQPGDGNGVDDAYLFDVAQNGLQRISETEAGADGGGASGEPVISGDGSMITFTSSATNLDPSDPDTNGQRDPHVRALVGGRAANLRRLSRNQQGAQANGGSQNPAMNYNGTALLFDSIASNLSAGGSNGALNVYLRNNPLTPDTLFRAGFE